MDVETWIIAQLEPMQPDASGEVTMNGPGALTIRAEAVWWEPESPEAACRGVNVEISIAGEPVGSFAYAVAESGRRALLDRLEPDQAARVAAAVENDVPPIRSGRAPS
jgi:hypothetical protein